MIKTYILTLLIFLSILAACNNSGNKWECEGNCSNGYGIKKWTDGSYEKGNWRKGKLYGFGVQFFGTESKFAGDTYVGNFDNGYHGYGTYYGKKLDFVHKGYFLNWKAEGHGFGKFGPNSNNPGWQYDGEYKAGVKSGFGVVYMGTRGRAAGIRYVGNWVNDMMDGQGKYYWPDGSHYDGHFSNDLFDGKATFTFNDSSLYHGTWSQGIDTNFLKLLKYRRKTFNNKDSVLTKFFLDK